MRIRAMSARVTCALDGWCRTVMRGIGGGGGLVVISLHHRQLAHLALRVTLGVNVAAHGLVRIGDPLGFARGLASGFAGILPEALVVAFGAVLPFAELGIGVAVLGGVALIEALFVGALVIAALTFGSCLQQKWETVGLQLVYALAYFVLLYTADEARLQLWRPRGRAGR